MCVVIAMMAERYTLHVVVLTFSDCMNHTERLSTRVQARDAKQIGWFEVTTTAVWRTIGMESACCSRDTKWVLRI